jgi:hypothetical protein
VAALLPKGPIKEFAAGFGKSDFFLVGEVAGGDGDADRYLEELGSNLSATLDIGEIRPALTAVANQRLGAAIGLFQPAKGLGR